MVETQGHRTLLRDDRLYHLVGEKNGLVRPVLFRPGLDGDEPECVGGLDLDSVPLAPDADSLKSVPCVVLADE